MVTPGVTGDINVFTPFDDSDDIGYIEISDVCAPAHATEPQEYQAILLRITGQTRMEGVLPMTHHQHGYHAI